MWERDGVALRPGFGSGGGGGEGGAVRGCISSLYIVAVIFVGTKLQGKQTQLYRNRPRPVSARI